MSSAPSAEAPRAPSPSADAPPTKRVKLDIESPATATAPAAPADGAGAPTATDGESQPMQQQPKKREPRKKNKKVKVKPPTPGGAEEAIYFDIVTLLGEDVVSAAEEAGTSRAQRFAVGTEVELEIKEISSHGDGLAVVDSGDWVVAVPFCLPGERVLARVYRNAHLHSYADFVRVIDACESGRDDKLVGCKYFGQCSGCQYQMVPYENQLLLKQRVVEKAYTNFSHLPSELVPPVLPTIASPKQYNYRTKITPHFQAPPKNAKADWEVRIGFDQKGRRTVMDIEECPIATKTLNDALGPERAKVKENIRNYKKGATLLLRDSLVRPDTDAPAEELADALDKHVCITEHKAIVREKVGDKLFEFTAGSFFQNNQSILEPLTQYVLDALPPASPSGEPMYLVDAYCGSGLFSITLASRFLKVAGVEISDQSVAYAKHNAALNGLPEDKAQFHVGNAEKIFDSVKDFPPNQTVVIVDPPRKGCDDAFLDQLRTFRPETVLYISCNVHTQARDVGKLCGEDGPYILESLRGFDLFPQTSHVEGVAVLRRKPAPVDKGESAVAEQPAQV